MTFMFEVTTASPKRPNFFSYCFCTVARNVSSLMPLCFRNGETRKNAPRNELPCMRSCSSPRSVAFRAMSKPGRMKMRMLFSLNELAGAAPECAATRSRATRWIPTRGSRPCSSPSSGLVCVNAFGSQHSTTSTWFSSQFTRIRSGATIR